MGGDKSGGHLTAAAPTDGGWLYFSAALTPYDLENLYDQIVTLGGRDRGDVHVEVDLGGASRNGPELRALTRRVKRLKRNGVTVRLHAARPRRPSPAGR
jgi:hypothetical protein